MFDVRGKVVVITGGMGQLGVIYANAFADHGAKVALVDVITDSVYADEKFTDHLEREKIAIFKADVTDSKQIEDCYKEIQSAFSTPNVLINNAAIDSPPDAPSSEVGPFETYPESSFDKVMEVNVKGTFLCCQIFGKEMAELGRGSIINISSIYGILSPCQDIYEYRRKSGDVFYKPAAYSTSKSAILNLTRYLATYWAKSGVRVNTLTLAGVFNDQPNEFLDSYNSRIPIGRMAEAKEFIGPLLLLASDASSYMTGSNLVVDGGWSAW